MTLLPGDVLLAGLPVGTAGVGGPSLSCGDEISVSIDSIGILTNRVDKVD